MLRDLYRGKVAHSSELEANEAAEAKIIEIVLTHIYWFTKEVRFSSVDDIDVILLSFKKRTGGKNTFSNFINLLICFRELRQDIR